MPTCTFSDGDAWKSVSTPIHHDAGPVVIVPEKSIDLGARPKEKTAVAVTKPKESGSKKESAFPKAVTTKDDIDKADKQEEATVIDIPRDKETAHEGAEVSSEKRNR